MKATRLLACVDGSAEALQAARLAFALAAEWGATVRAISVVDDADLALLEPVTAQRATLQERLRQAGQATLAHVEEMGRAAGVVTQPVLAVGNPFEKILDEARHWQPDFIFMGRTGRRGPGRVLVGSETERVLEFTSWPVVVVPRETPTTRPV
ncbi:MAG TPA: universal stress protein [Candidatus Limnocylindrales bacterium]|nr:universal stress protein [Candidatus Limnocylindrales bacterium]